MGGVIVQTLSQPQAQKLRMSGSSELSTGSGSDGSRQVEKNSRSVPRVLPSELLLPCEYGDVEWLSCVAPSAWGGSQLSSCIPGAMIRWGVFDVPFPHYRQVSSLIGLGSKPEEKYHKVLSLIKVR